MALALAISALVFAPAAANATAPPTTTYLALGDSISFGYTAEKFKLHEPNESPSYFEEGFTNYFTADLKKATEVGKTIRLVNDGCPGETSNGLIGENPAVGGEASTEGPFFGPGSEPQEEGDWHPCAYHFVGGFPLHNSLGTLSQLEDAVSVVLPKENTEVISVQLGSNDELAGIAQCKKELKEEFVPPYYTATQPNSKSAPGDPEDGTKHFSLNGTEPHDAITQFEAFQACLAGSAVFKTTPRIVKNTKDVLEQLDATGYSKPIVLLGFYNPDAFVLPGSDTLQQHVNNEVKAAAEATGLTNIHWANPFPKFNDTSTAVKEKKSIKTYTEMCNPAVQAPLTGFDPGCEGDIHPSLAGYHAMAKIVNEAYLAPALP